MLKTPDDVFNECVELSANDKISYRNAWQLQLIDCIDEVIDFEHCDFIRSAGAIQASAKIYSTRVDVLAKKIEVFQEGESVKEDHEESNVETGQTQKVMHRVVKTKFKRAAAEDLELHLEPNAYFDSNFHQMFAVGDSQLLGETELFMPFEFGCECDIADVPGMQELLTKSERFLEASEPEPVNDLQYEANEADVMTASYVSILSINPDSAVEDSFAFSAFPNKHMTVGSRPRVPRVNRPPREELVRLSLQRDIKLLGSMSKTQAKFVLENEQPAGANYFYLENRVFCQDNINRFLLSCYKQTHLSKMASVTELSVQNEVHFADNLTADEVDREMEDFLEDEGNINVEKPDALSQSMENSTFKYLEDENLIQKRLTIGLNVVTTKFARRPKQVNISELKNCIETEVKTLNCVDFGGLIDNYEEFHSKQVGLLEDVSAGMVFVGLLHLASESSVELDVDANGRIVVEPSHK